MNRKVLASVDDMAQGGAHLLFVDEEGDDLELKGFELRRSMLVRLGMKRARFQGCGFLQSVFRDCYFREASFTDVDFTGSLFEDCNFERAAFRSCTLRYTRFRRCSLNISEMLGSLPSESNLRHQVLCALEQNERELGHRAAADQLTVAIRQTRKEELWRRVRASSTYYAERYKPEARFRSLFELMFLSVSDVVWGYGLRIRRLLMSGAAFIVLQAGIIRLFTLPYFPPEVGTARALSFGEAIYVSTLSFATLGFGGYAPASCGSQVVSVLGGLLGAVFIAFLAASLFRRIVR